MFSEKIQPLRLSLWMVVALSGPLAQLAGVTSWLTAGLTAAVTCVLCVAVTGLKQTNLDTSKWVCILQLLWLGVFAGQMAAKSAFSWDKGDAYPIVPVVLLLLAAFSARSGGEKASRGVVSFLWLAGIMFALVLGAGTAMLRGRNLSPEWQKPSWEMVNILLIPAVSLLLPAENRGKSRWASVATAIFAVIVNIWVIGCMSPRVAMEESGAFLKYSKSISLFGVAERFEAAVSCALTVGWFALLSLLLAAAGYQAELVCEGKGQWGVWICMLIAIVSVLLRWDLRDWMVAGSALLFWIFLPACNSVIRHRKKLKKDKNSS